jgi:Biotin carboxylase, N-terminal domain
MATASVLGIETVAVYAADDAACGHVGRAEVAVELPGPGAAAYLDVDAVVAAAVSAGCDTLHPGYGFASERPQLAARCAGAGVRFVGPAPGALTLFGDKGAARARARELGVPVLPGTARRGRGCRGGGGATLPVVLRRLGPGPAAPGRGDRRRRRRQGHGVPRVVRGTPAAGRLARRYARLHGGARGGADGHRAALRRAVRGRRPAHRAGLRGGAAQGLRPRRDGDDRGRPAPPGHHGGLADRGVRRHGPGGRGAAGLPCRTRRDRGPRCPAGALRGAGCRAVHPRQGSAPPPRSRSTM